ncbi:lipase domain-containing protein [Caerostris darwini]|uniref:Lipase domain-containing protein n=1 Tax=Caerostris darwini TaxID=1538125 RepID=A0AAV4T4G3_9ARAC|nr:lipase domain-containing protein [Caerostris darwini]
MTLTNRSRCRRIYIWRTQGEGQPSRKMSLLVFGLVLGSLAGEVILEDPLNVGALDEPILGLFPNKCITDLGCFYTGPPFFHPLHRPISLPPSDHIPTRFLLYTPSNRDQPQQLDWTKEEVVRSNFESAFPTKIIIHGYTDTLPEGDVLFVSFL